MATIRRTPQADQDLFEVGAYIARDDQTAADRFVGKVDGYLMLLANNPEAGRPRPALGAAVRTFPVDGYLIVYRPIPDGIQVLRFLHGARDLEELL